MPLRIPGSLPVRIGLSAGVVLIALYIGLRLVAGIFGKFNAGKEAIRVYSEDSAPRVEELRQASKTTIKWKTVYVPVPEIKIFDPTPEEIAKFEKKTGIPLGAQLEAGEKLLAIREFEPARYGGRIEATLKPSGETGLTIQRFKAPFLELGGQWRIGVGASFDQDRKIGYEAELKKDLLTLRGNWHLSAAARASLVDSETDVRLLARLERSF